MTLTGGGFAVTCTSFKGGITLQEAGQTGVPPSGQFAGVTFGGCTEPKLGSCTVVPTALPWGFVIVYTAPPSHAHVAIIGTFAGGTTGVGVAVQCGGLTCTFSVPFGQGGFTARVESLLTLETVFISADPSSPNFVDLTSGLFCPDPGEIEAPFAVDVTDTVADFKLAVI